MANDTQVFILASGAGERWKDNDPPFKQLVAPPGYPPVIVRMIEHFAPRYPVAVVTPHAAIVEALSAHLSAEIKKNSLTIMDVGSPPLMTETLRLTRPAWKDVNLGLLGDVWFSDRALKEMEVRLQEREIHVYGRRERSLITLNAGETFAFQWCREHFDALEGAAQAALEGWEKGGHGSYDRIGTPHGCPWQLYRALNDIPLDQHRFAPGNMWVEINDFTDDFDSPENYKVWEQRFRRRLFCEPKLDRVGDFENWRMGPKPLDYVIMSAGHSGSGYVAKLLTSAGIPCGHEGIFRDKVLTAHQYRADSSFFAVAHLKHRAAEGAKLVHLVRHPLKVIRSWKYGGTSAANDRWMEAILKREGMLDFDVRSKEASDLAMRWVRWNELIEKKAPGATVVRVEDRKEILRAIGHPSMQKVHCHGSFAATQRAGEWKAGLFDDPRYNIHVDADRPNVTWSDLGAAEDMVRSMARRYGYDV